MMYDVAVRVKLPRADGAVVASRIDRRRTGVAIHKHSRDATTQLGGVPMAVAFGRLAFRVWPEPRRRDTGDRAPTRAMVPIFNACK